MGTVATTITRPQNIKLIRSIRPPSEIQFLPEIVSTLEKEGFEKRENSYFLDVCKLHGRDFRRAPRRIEVYSTHFELVCKNNDIFKIPFGGDLPIERVIYNDESDFNSKYNVITGLVRREVTD